jgi:hypothetical protein
MSNNINTGVVGNWISSSIQASSIDYITTESKRDKEVVEFLEFIMSILGVKITFDEFIKMTDDDKKTLLRDIKINSIL